MAALRKARVFVDGAAKPDCLFGDLSIGDVYQIIEPDGEVAFKSTFQVTGVPVQDSGGFWNVPSIIIDGDGGLEQSS